MKKLEIIIIIYIYIIYLNIKIINLFPSCSKKLTGLLQIKQENGLK